MKGNPNLAKTLAEGGFPPISDYGIVADCGAVALISIAVALIAAEARGVGH